MLSVKYLRAVDLWAVFLGMGGPLAACSASPPQRPLADPPRVAETAMPSAEPPTLVAADASASPGPAASAMPSAAASAAPNATASATTAPLAPPAIPKGAKVLHLGDSFAGALGLELNAVLKERGAEGVLRFKTASFIPEWAWKGGIPQFMAEHRPDLVLITLGANEVAIREPESRVAVIEKLVKQFGDTPCVWIAIPLWANDTGLMPVIRDHCAPCRFMDSNELRFADGTRVRDMPRLPDKIHPTMRARRQWAEFVVDWLAEQRDPVGPKLWSLRTP